MLQKEKEKQKTIFQMIVVVVSTSDGLQLQQCNMEKKTHHDSVTNFSFISLTFSYMYNVFAT